MACCVTLLWLGVPPHIVRDIVGHANLDVTMIIYADGRWGRALLYQSL